MGSGPYTADPDQPLTAVSLFKSNRALTAALSLTSLGFAWAQMWGTRHLFGGDGISYLEHGEAFVRDTDAEAISTIWSPLYSWLLGFGLWAFDPGRNSEAVMVKSVNLVVFVVALAAFALLLSQLLAFARGRAEPDSLARVAPDWAWLVLGFSLFTWSTLELVGVPTATPDLLGETVLLASLGIVLRIRRGFATPAMFALLGMTLAVGYLAKAFLFPVAPVLFVIAVIGMAHGRRALVLLAVSMAVFLTISGPWVLLVSKEAGHPSFSELGNFAYLAYVNQVPDRNYQGGAPDPGAPLIVGQQGGMFPQGGISGVGTPVHPTRQLRRDPPVFEYAQPVGGTTPILYEPGYWYEGVRAQFDLEQQVTALAGNVRLLQQRVGFIAPLWFFPVFFVLLAAFSGRRWKALADLASFWPVLLPAVVFVSLVLLVYVEGRYLGAIPPMVWLAAFASQRATAGRDSARTFAVGAVLLAAALTFPLVQSVPGWLSTPDNPDAQVADGLLQRGVQPGEGLVVLSSVAGTGGTSWARLADVRLVGEIQQPDRFWEMPDAAQTRLLDELAAKSGATNLVTDGAPPPSERAGWTRLPGTTHYLYPLARPPSS